jgi:sortase B
MFHPLLQYKSEDYYKEHQDFVVYTENEVIIYHVFSAYFADNDEVFGEDYTDACENGITIEKIKEIYTSAMEKSLYDIVYIPDTSDIIILSTCEYSGNNNRMVVYGVKER